MVILQRSPFCNQCPADLAEQLESGLDVLPETCHLVLVNPGKPDARLRTTKALQKLVKAGQAFEASFALPHLGPEGLTIVDSKHIVLVNDNNFPYSSGRTIGKPDDNEFTLLNIEALVNAK